ncbi:MAG: PhzF family phenazine biosynthesis protein, partial [Thermoplasmata archaeon]|nr:PhzF family phenazine biosynthesis protein [Thermoplasmata archaeon]
MGQIIHQVDAFTDVAFKGNPAAVCILREPRDEEWMQNVAREMNLSETAFLLEAEDGYDLRWFTPTVEVDLCGHATLASAHILWELGQVRPEDECRFHSKSGLLRAEKERDWIELDFPALMEEEAATPEGLVAALGVEPQYVGRNADNYLVEVESEEAVRGMAPNFT